MTDQIQRFIFDDSDIRGELVNIQHSYQDTLANHSYPAPVSRMLGEFLVAAALLSDIIKFDGILTLQARSEGEIPLIMAECRSDGSLRGIAKEAADASSEDFQTLLNNGQLSITVDPDKGQRYQGIVPMEGASLAECLQHYFQQSEQLSTRLWLAADGKTAAGMMLQELPASEILDKQQREQQWQHISELANTTKTEELLTLDFETLLFRLYHQEQVRLFEASTLCFRCSCSRTRTASAIRAIGQQEAEAIIAEAGAIEINCEFCHHHYHFNGVEVAEIFNPPLH